MVSLKNRAICFSRAWPAPTPVPACNAEDLQERAMPANKAGFKAPDIDVALHPRAPALF
jgi:hypothetical protein